MSETEVKRALRAAKRTDPEAFERLIREYMERGDGAIAAPKPGENAGRPREMNDEVLGMFLAEVLNRLEEGASQNQAIREVVERKAFWQSPAGYYGTFENESTTKSHFFKLRQRYNEDTAFAERVEFYRWALTQLGQK